MDVNRFKPTPQQAREQLAAAQSRSLASPRDRRIHAVGMVFFGVVIGLHMATRNLVSEGVYALLGLVTISILLVGMIWIGRTARTVPRRVRMWSLSGFIASFLVGLWLVTPWLNFAAQTTPNSWPMILCAAAAVATPCLIAAAVIAMGRK